MMLTSREACNSVHEQKRSKQIARKVAATENLMEPIKKESVDEEKEYASDHEAASVLPDGLQLLAIELNIQLEGRPFCGSDIAEIEADPEYAELLEILGSLGDATEVLANKASMFGRENFFRVRLDIIGASEVLQKWFLLPGEKYGLDKFAFKFSDKSSISMAVSHSTMGSSLGHKYTEFDEPFFDDYFASRQFAIATKVTDEKCSQIAAVAEACNGDITTVGTMLRMAWRKYKSQAFLVHGLIPRKTITLLLGNKKVGKSVIVMELSVAVSRRESEWLGFPLDLSAGGYAVYLLGEDTVETAMDRVKRMTGGVTPHLLFIVLASDRDIDHIFAKLEKVKVALVVVDPARKFFRGDEDGSDAVNDFFTKLETFAAHKGCAVVVLHHLKRNAKPKNLNDVALLYRGSSVFLDRPRVTLALLRVGDETQFGIPSNDGTPFHNFPASTMFSGVRRLRRSEETFRHVPIELESPAVSGAPVDEVSRVLETTAGLLQVGKRVTRTGRFELFEQSRTELDGLSRAKIRRATDALIAEGKLVCGADGGLSLPLTFQMNKGE
jgi:hypothetical protein